MKTILLCRVSSKEQEETGYSLDAQEKLLTDYALKVGLDINKVFKISESASGKQIRKLFNDMFQYVLKNNISVICCEKIDRLTRNLKDAAIVNDWIHDGDSRQVHFVKENFILNKNTRAHESLVWDMKVSIARFYTNNLSEEVRKGQKEKVSQGLLPTRALIGYKTIGDKGHKIHVIDEVTGPYIRKMFELYSTGNYSLNALVKLMYKEGMRNHYNHKVGKSSMHKLLSNPFYYGKMMWNGELLPAKHEVLVSKELFDKVQERLVRKHKNPQYKKHSTVFKAKIDCSECGGTITWEVQKGHWYGHCNHYKACSQSKWWKQEDVEKFLFPMFDGVAPKNQRILKILEKALKESHKDEIAYNGNSVTELNRQLETAQKRIEAIYEDKIDGKITPDFYEKKFKEYNNNKSDAIEALKKLGENNTKYYEVGYAIHELASKAVDIYNSPKASVDEKRLLLSKVFSNLTMEAKDIRPNYTFAFQFLKEWVPRLNNTFEPSEYGSTKTQNEQVLLAHPVVLRDLDSNQEPID